MAFLFLQRKRHAIHACQELFLISQMNSHIILGDSPSGFGGDSDSDGSANMTQQSKPTEVGPLFAGTEVVEKEPEVIWDDNDENPADEARWLSYFSAHEASITAAEEKFIAEYKRRRELASGS
jgi:hypothetical protein